MRLLAVETATVLGGVALMEGDRLMAESRVNIRVTHSERLMKEIDRVLGSAGMSVEDIDVFGVSIGPGSFTGLRVGLSAIKGLVYATGKKMAVAPTLEALAWNIPYSNLPVCTMLDARKKEVYGAVFKWHGNGFERVIEECTLPVNKLTAMISEPTIFIGEGASLYRDIISSELGAKALFGLSQQMVPSPANVALLCARSAAAGMFCDPVETVPFYFRRSEAELKTA